VYNSKGGDARHFLTKAVMKPKFLGGEAPEIKPGEDRRKVLAEWIASPRIRTLLETSPTSCGRTSLELGSSSQWMMSASPILLQTQN
jgi:hypothetical protein